MSNTIEARALSKCYGSTYALNDVTMAVPSGQVIGLLGHNGAGKSTLIKLVLGLIRPTAGRIRTLGSDPFGRDSDGFRVNVGYLPENATFYANLTAGEVMDYLAALKRTSKRSGRKLLERVGLSSAVNRHVATYSKGMRQRLGLAQALLASPDLLLLDEPTTGLDPMATRDFFVLVHELREAGKTILISSHLLAELEPHLDRAVILGDGRVLAQGTVSELRGRAGLPVHVSARFSAGIDAVLDQPWLTELACTVLAQDATEISLDVPIENKVEVVRRLMALPDLADIRVAEPTLASLYQSVEVLSANSAEAGDE